MKVYTKEINMKVNTKQEYKNGQFIFTRTVSEFTDYELEVLKKLYDNNIKYQAKKYIKSIP